MAYSPWGRKGSDRTEHRAHTHTHIHRGTWAPERAEEPRALLTDHVHEPGLMEHGLGVLGLEGGPLSR